jgi:hypothetical protein
MPWQRWLLIHALELRPDGRFRFRTILILVARQNGKTTLIEVKNLWKMFVLQVPLVIGTAQNLDISEESWDKACEIVEGIPELAAEIEHVDKTNGKKALKLAHGSRWKIAAASRKGGRGLSGDDVNLDELREHQNWDAWGAVTKTTMARAKAQIWGFSNAGDDKSLVLNSLQEKARAAAENPDLDPTLGLFEWSGPDDLACTCDREDDEPHALDCRLQDPEIQAQANPSLGYPQGISHEALASALATDPVQIYLTECMCVRVRSLTEPRVIAEDLWLSLADTDSHPGRDIAIAVDVEPNRRNSSIAIYGPRADGKGHVELIAYRPGTAWLVPALVRLKELRKPVAIAIDTKGPAGSLLPKLTAAGITVPESADEPRRGDLTVPQAADVASAWGGFLDAVTEDDLRHRDQAPLTGAVGNAKVRKIGEAEGLARRTSIGDISPLVAGTLARWAYITRIDKIVPEEAEPEAWWV